MDRVTLEAAGAGCNGMGWYLRRLHSGVVDMPCLTRRVLIITNPNLPSLQRSSSRRHHGCCFNLSRPLSCWLIHQTTTCIGFESVDTRILTQMVRSRPLPTCLVAPRIELKIQVIDRPLDNKTTPPLNVMPHHYPEGTGTIAEITARMSIPPTPSFPVYGPILVLSIHQSQPRVT